MILALKYLKLISDFEQIQIGFDALNASALCPMLAGALSLCSVNLRNTQHNFADLIPLIIKANTNQNLTEIRKWMITDWYIRKHLFAWATLAGLDANYLKYNSEITSLEDALELKSKLQSYCAEYKRLIYTGELRDSLDRIYSSSKGSCPNIAFIFDELYGIHRTGEALVAKAIDGIPSCLMKAHTENTNKKLQDSLFLLFKCMCALK